MARASERARARRARSAPCGQPAGLSGRQPAATCVTVCFNFKWSAGLWPIMQLQSKAACSRRAAEAKGGQVAGLSQHRAGPCCRTCCQGGWAQRKGPYPGGLLAAHVLPTEREVLECDPFDRACTADLGVGYA